MEAAMLYVVTDFDGTLMREDVGDTIMYALGVMQEEGTRKAVRLMNSGQSGSKAWIELAYPYLKGKKAEVDRILEEVRPRDGAAEFLAFCRQHGIPVTILSDGMAYYIEELVKRHGLVVQQVVVNPIRYLEDGGYHVGAENRNPACDWCGCCKAGTVRQLKASGGQVIYVGDGSSDILGSGFADWIFARSTLARHLEEQGEAYFPFETFHDILKVVAPRVEQFQDGTAQGKRTQPNTFCRF
ncbi:MtnX-like HAD-IB family phosphatase [Gorillibacterium sp. sgz5001074]|uniref:MtnX-like HAD-IB family phosphatase n=1 Tax=Gorillibacterium sp. sgz5001074 TaxID=3446695 RepID=UPI003F67B8DB